MTLARFNGWENVWLIFYLSEYYLMCNRVVCKHLYVSRIQNRDIDFIS